MGGQGCGNIREPRLNRTCAQTTLHALVPCTLLQHQTCQSKITHKRTAIRALLLVHVSNLVCGSYPLGCTLLPDPLERWLKHQILLHPCDKLHCSTALRLQGVGIRADSGFDRIHEQQQKFAAVACPPRHCVLELAVASPSTVRICGTNVLTLHMGRKSKRPCTPQPGKELSRTAASGSKYV